MTQPPDDSVQYLGSGAAGIALLHIERAQTNQGSWATVHDHVVAMTSVPVDAHPDGSSLYRGAPAVAFVLHATRQAAYAKALATLDSHIEVVTRERLRRAHGRIDRGQLPALREFDLMSGLTGLGAYLLHRHGGGDLLREVLSYLVRLCEPVSLDGQILPGWWTNHDTADHPSSDWVGGHGNLGMAHGISGPLALLSIATRRNVDVPGQADAIDTICTWLDQWRQGDGTQAWWPGFVSMTELSTCAVQQQGPQRPSWCYGTPGMARAQQLAALALGDRRRQRDAEHALIGCITNNSQLAQLTDTSLCHGWAGLMQATWRSAADAGSGSQLAAHLPALSARLDRQLQLSQQPLTSGLLEGTAGVQLVQATTASIDPPVSDWDACLLLDG